MNALGVLLVSKKNPTTSLASFAKHSFPALKNVAAHSTTVNPVADFVHLATLVGQATQLAPAGESSVYPALQMHLLFNNFALGVAVLAASSSNSLKATVASHSLQSPSVVPSAV